MSFSPQISDSSSEDEDSLFPLPNLQTRLFLQTRRSGPDTMPATPTASLQRGCGVSDILTPTTRAQLFNSSPIIEKDPEELKAHRIKKGQKARAQKIAQTREKDSERREQATAAEEAARNAANYKDLDEILEDLLVCLSQKNLRLGDLLEYIFNPEMGKGSVRWHEFFVVRGRASRILDWWTSRQNSRSARNEVSEWAFSYTAKTVSKEAYAVTKSKELQTIGKSIDREFITSFSFTKIRQMLEEKLAPIAMRMIRGFSVSRAAETHSDRRRERADTVITSSALACLGEYSHSNNISKRMLGLYMYASGAQRQTISVLSTLGLSESYTNLITRNIGRKRKTKKGTETMELDDEPVSRTGTLRQLSESMITEAQDLSATGLFQGVFDNVNVDFRNGEQILGRHDSQENGTCATIVPLFEAKLEDMKVSDFRANFLKAGPMKLDEILHSSEERKMFKQNLIFTILRVIVQHGGEGFKKYEKELEKDQPQTTHKIKLHKSTLHPLPAMHIDESTIVGNAEVDEAIRKELRLDQVPESSERIRFHGGDQLSVARLRALELIRAGQEGGYNGFFWGIWVPGLFHVKIADTHGTFLNHWGKPNNAPRNPGSLWFHNTCLHRLPIVVSSLPSFRVCRDLVFVSMYARVLHCLLLVSGHSSLDSYLEKGYKWDELVSHATKLYAQFATASVAEELREEREEEATGAKRTAKPTKGDQVLENGILFLRDSLISREYSNAIKAGDSGRVLLVLKVWALAFRGNGRTKYAFEMLHLIHHITNVWSSEVRDILLKNWLLNPSGLLNSFIELDLAQEHLNFWIKSYYKAHGSNATWDWLRMIAPTVEVLRMLSKIFNDVLGSDQGTKHAAPELTEDIQTLMKSLKEHDVYCKKPGRVLDDDEPPVKDVIAVGLQSISQGTKNPLTEYNAAFKRLQTRRRMCPIQSPTLPIPLDQTSTATSHPSHSTTPILITNTREPVAIIGQDKGKDYAVAEDDTDIEESRIEELAQMLEEVEQGIMEPTLSRLTEDDVALDMDNTFVTYDDESSDESDGELQGNEEEDEQVAGGIDVEYLDL